MMNGDFNKRRLIFILASIVGAGVFLFLSWTLTDWLMDYPSLSKNTMLLILGGPCYWYLYLHSSLVFWVPGVLVAYWPLGRAIATQRVSMRAVAWAIGLWVGQGIMMNASGIFDNLIPY